MERCNSNRCGCNHRGMMNNNRSCPGVMPIDNRRCDNGCSNMCDNKDNNNCMKDSENMCGRNAGMCSGNLREDNMRGDSRRYNNMRSGCRSCNDKGSHCGMDNSMSSRRGNKNDMEGFAPAMAYVPWQKWCEVYPLNTGLQRGTIFPELDKPFFKGRCCNL